jgi:hypothetical protein
MNSSSAVKHIHSPQRGAASANGPRSIRAGVNTGPSFSARRSHSLAARRCSGTSRITFYPRSARISDAVMADPSTSPSSTTAVNSSRLRSCSATTRSSMVP